MAVANNKCRLTGLPKCSHPCVCTDMQIKRLQWLDRVKSAEQGDRDAMAAIQRVGGSIKSLRQWLKKTRVFR